LATVTALLSICMDSIFSSNAVVAPSMEILSPTFSVSSNWIPATLILLKKWVTLPISFFSPAIAAPPHILLLL